MKCGVPAGRWRRILVFVLVCKVQTFCGALAAWPLPSIDLRGLEPDVAEALRTALDTLRTAQADKRLAEDRLAETFGNTGFLFHAHLILDAARSCYENAAQLQPADYRWPYYLGYLAQQTGHLDEAAEAYRKALGLHPALSVAQLRLGRILAELGATQAAETSLQVALQDSGLAPAARFELGKLALTRGDYGHARDLFVRVIEDDPAATRVHYSLAMALRALGDPDQARRELAMRGERDPAFPDPLVDALAGLSTGQRMLFHAGMNAAHLDDFTQAAGYFERGLQLEPDNLAARVSLARFLFLSGRAADAKAQLATVLQAAPRHVLAGFLAAVLAEAQGDVGAAIAGYRQVLETDPSHPGAHYFLAGTLFRNGDFAAAAGHYAASLEQAPDNVAAAFQRIGAEILAGTAEARILDMIVSAQARHGQNASLDYLLVALLAAADNRRLRHPDKALALALALYERDPSVEHARLIAMAYAGKGDFSAAETWQERALDAAFAAFRFDRIDELKQGLAYFRRGEGFIGPWTAADLAAMRPSLQVRRAFRAYPPERAY